MLLADVPAGLRACVSSHVGLVCGLEEQLAGVDEPPVIRVSCETAAGDELIGTSLGHVAGLSGAGRTRAEALGAAIGEAVERYSASYLPHERFVSATAAELDPHAAAPECFALFSREQYARPGFPFVPFTRSSRVRWVDGWDLRGNDAAWLPVELVFLADAIRTGETRIGYSTSNGAACAGTREAAVERGLLELLERDAFMLTWAHRRTLPTLDCSADPVLSALEKRYFRPTGLRYFAVDLSSFHDLPIVLGVVRAPGTGGALGVGAAAAPTVGRAWFKALCEAFASRSAARKLSLVHPDREFAPDGSDVVTFEDHIRYYAADERAAATSFLTEGEPRPVADLPSLSGTRSARVEGLIDRIATAGSGAYAVDVTSPDVRSLGLHVVKTVAPGLCALDVAHVARFLGSPRILAMSGTDTLTSGARSTDDLNPLPHPFP